MIDFELARKSAHLIVGLCALSVIFYLGYVGTFLLIIAASLFIFLAHINKTRKMTLIDFLLRAFERKNAKFPGKGLFTLLLGISLTYIIFPEDIAFGAMMVVIVGDTVSNLGGKYFGKIKLYKTRTLEGFLGGIVFSIIGAQLFLPLNEAIIASVVGMIIEIFCNETFDDNLFIPLASALSIFLFRLF